MEKRLHTKKDAEYCLWYFKKYIHEDSKLIGSFAEGKETSDHDIDIFIPYKIRKPNLRDKSKFYEILDAKKVEDTDWGGWFFYDTPFGNVDVFFDITGVIPNFKNLINEIKNV